MRMHTTTGRWRLGLALTLITALSWGVLPIALKIMLTIMDAVTVTWYRFLIASVLLFSILIHKKQNFAAKDLWNYPYSFLKLFRSF